MQTHRYLIVVFATFCGLMALAGLDSWMQIDSPTSHGFYTCSYIQAKIARGSRVARPKIVIISGSNALAGIDAPTLGRELGTNVFNFGLAASFGPGFQSFQAAKVLRPGDAALLPLEYLAYDYSKPQDSLVDAAYSCGSDYLRSLDWKQRLAFILAVRPQRLADSVLFRLHPQKARAIAALAGHDVNAYGQRPGGDFPDHHAQIAADMARHEPLAIHMDRSSPGAAAIAGFVGWAREHRVTVFATWPNTLYFPQYHNAPVFTQIRTFFSDLGVDVIGTPEDAMFSLPEMGDTLYHLNHAGIMTRTARLAAALRADAGFSHWRRSGPRISAARLAR